MQRKISIVVITSLISLSACGPSETSVTTQRYDNARTGQNLNEKLLNTSNVNADGFGKLFTRDVDDEIYAQPLYVPSVRIRGGLRNVLYVATVNNTVYAFDADKPDATAPLWKVNLTDIVPGATPVSTPDVGQLCGKYRNISKNIGIVGTPVIDESRQTIYLIARTKEGNNFVQRLHALDITSGASRPSSPVIIRAKASGKGIGSSNGKVHFDPRNNNQRAALLLANGTIYIGWASHCDTGPFHGWLIGYDAATLKKVLVSVLTPNGWGGGIWQSNSGPSSDSSGAIYLTVGNGTASAQIGGKDYGNAFIKLSPDGAVLDWFIPFNFEALNAVDGDLGSAGVLLIPNTNLLTSGGKQGKLYVLKRRRLGHFREGADTQIVQSFTAADGGLYSTPSYWEGPQATHIYVWGAGDRGKMFRLGAGQLYPTPVTETRERAPWPGGFLSLSANGAIAGTGILWALTGSDDAMLQTVPGILHAFDAADLAHELWNSAQNMGRDNLGALSKFNTPVVANGKVYVATFSNQVVVYGLLHKSTGEGKN